MEATSARVVPHIMRACRSPPRGPPLTWLSSTCVSTSSEISSLSSPSLPFAVSVPPAIATCTPEGISTGYLPTRDMCCAPSEHATQDLAANIGGAGLGIAQHPTRGGQDGDAESGIEPRQLLDLRIHAASRLGDPVDLLN